MPKSKNRRKPGKPGSTSSVSAEVNVDDAEKGNSAPAKEKISPMKFFSQVRDEGRKITWTSRNETMISTVMVLIMVLIMSLFFFAVDEVLRRVIPLILNTTA